MAQLQSTTIFERLTQTGASRASARTLGCFNCCGDAIAHTHREDIRSHIRVIASDTIGNWKRGEVSVNVGSPGGQDPDGDGHDNLIELALGTPPLESNPGTVLTTLEAVGEARHLQLDVAKNPRVGNVIFRAEVAGDLAGPWSSDPLTAIEILHDDAERLIARDRTAAGAAAKRFIRLRIDTAQ